MRDGAYSAAIKGGASETIAKILGWHKISGTSDAYIKQSPKMVANGLQGNRTALFRRERMMDSVSLGSSAGRMTA